MKTTAAVRFLIQAFLFCFFLFEQQTYAQSNSLEVSFVAKEILITQGDLVSNVLRIYNPTQDSLTFHVSADFPAEWKSVSRVKELYTIGAKDSMFIPFRLIPAGNLMGNNRFMISCFIVSKDQQQLGNDFFWAFTQKQTSWSISSDQGSKIYFKTNTTTAPFNINLLNTGTERQPIILSLNNMSLFAEVTDSGGQKIYNKPINLQLDPYQDTTYQFVFRYTQGVRNESRIDIENYRPENLNEEKVFNLLVTSEEPNVGQTGVFQAGQRITFKKLSDDKRVNAQSFSTIPLVVDYNVSNLMDEISFSTLNLRGVAQLDASSQVIYNMQASATSNSYSDFLNNNNYYIGYFANRGSVQVGYINGGLMGAQSFGKGVKASVNMGTQNAVSAFYITRADRYNQEVLSSIGTALDLTYFKQNKMRFELGRSDNKSSGVITTVANMRGGINIYKQQNITFSISNTFNDIGNQQQGNQQTHGYFVMGNYSGSFLRDKISITHGLGYNTKDYANALVERKFYNHRLRITMSEAWSFTMANSYNHTQTLSTVVAEVSSLTNQVALNRSSGSKSIQPKVFYNIFHQPTFSYTIRGAGLSFNQFNVKTGTRFSTTIEGGVNTPVNIPNSSETSYMQWSSLAFFKTVSLNARYLSGTYGYVPPAAGGSTTPNQQLFMSSAQHQYVLRNGKVMIQTGANYFYNNAFKQHSITLTPDIYYFSKDGWRFRVSFNYNLISSIPLKNNYGTQPTSEDAQTRMTTQNTFISLGIRKEFNLPIPFKKVKFCDVKFVAFYDVNGNGIKDNSEKELENVVVRVGEDEVITNSAGEAHMRNIDIKKHSIAAFALDNQDGWFPNIEDSMVVFKHKTMNIPFVKGIRIKGKITIDRESINADADEPFDLSRIRITASSQKQISVLTDFNGSFEFYLPYGKYVLTMDEGVLGSRYKIARNNYEIDVNKDADGMVISYLIIEKKRKIVKKVFSQPLPVEPPKPENKPVIKTPRKAK